MKYVVAVAAAVAVAEGEGAAVQPLVIAVADDAVVWPSDQRDFPPIRRSLRICLPLFSSPRVKKFGVKL